MRIRLADERPAPQPDPLGRTHLGYAADLRPAELWERARGVWKAKLATLAECVLAVIVYDDKVVGVGMVEAIVPHEDRVAIDGRLVVDHPLVGHRDPLPNASRNPITYGVITAVMPTSPPARPYESVLKDAIAVLTEAGRLRRPLLRPVEVPADGSLRDVRWEVDPGRSEQADWAEFVTLALAGATANLGGIDSALAGRSGSWEAAGVRSLLESTVGPDEDDLWRHRTEPLTITLFVEDLVAERTRMWEGYNDAEAAVQQMYREAEAANPPIDPEPYLWRYQRTVDGEGEAATVGPWEPVDPAAPAWSLEAWRAANTFGSEDEARYWERMILGQEMAWGRDQPITEAYLPKSPELGAEYDRLVDEREARLASVAELEEQLEEQRAREIAAYGQALKERVEAAARSLPGLGVPVEVDVDRSWSSRASRLDDMPAVVERLVDQAVMDTPAPEDLPGTPLSRLLGYVERPE
ncbi:hypothetical protein [Nocardioides sp. KR10-350]|uniref:hypothetical protein n=1 Tax=Nocardioides cheoyonin TaxID=3156615 RepID=UPI0032B5376B